MSLSHLLRQSSQIAFDPAQGASRAEYREIHGDLISSGERVMLHCWAIVFDHELLAQSRYDVIVALLGEVRGDARALIRLTDAPVDRFGNLSERDDLIGELATIWVTANQSQDPARGAVLLSVDTTLVHLIVIDPYLATGHERAVRIVEQLARAMAQRQAEIMLPPGADTMARLPILADLGDSLENTKVGINRYTARPQ